MPSFSQRKGFTPVRDQIQADYMDNDLRNGLWNALTICFWRRVTTNWLHNHSDINLLCHRVYQDYFKQTIDSLNDHWPTTYDEIRGYFFSCEWYEAYDFVEFVAQTYFEPSGGDSLIKTFTATCNATLKRELSAYRFVDRTITQITSEEEMSEIEEALETSDSSKAVANHLGKALTLLMDRKTPDYANSIKESISAVEAICNQVTDSSGVTLGQALNKLEKAKTVKIHAALREAFSKLYGYTSNVDGIRHALLEESTLDFEDAKFMLVSCSAFVNYLKEKSAKAGIQL